MRHRRNRPGLAVAGGRLVVALSVLRRPRARVEASGGARFYDRRR